jgi:succinate-semialdehyde dehydrogenase/glutarate-semialdehyde dehydrogenase
LRYESINPATEERVAAFDVATAARVEEALDLATKAFLDWRRRPIADRAALLERVAGLLEGRAGEWARLMAEEMGKPLAEGEAEAKKCAWACRWFAAEAPAMLAPEPRPSDGSRAYVRHDPLGPVLAIMPWNFPFWQFFRFAAPALTAGDVAVLKHAPNTPRCALAIEGLFREAGAPPGVVQSLFLSDEQAAAAIADPRVRGVTLTGSTRAGREVASAAGRALKPMVMELGGSDPFLVFPDADLDEAVKVGVASRCVNGGQSCIAAKRFLVHRDVFDRYAKGFVEGMKARVTGDPTKAGVNVGPMARRDLRDGLASQVERSVAAGARVLLGGKTPAGKGFFYPPTVLVDVKPGTPAAVEELFGPVAALIPFRTEEEALAIANGTAYGLGSSLWTSDPARVERMAAAIDAGSVFVNGMVKSDPRLPFGGVRDSGFGRELAREGMLEFVNVKTVWIR